jgi:hypothetical protein
MAFYVWRLLEILKRSPLRERMVDKLADVLEGWAWDTFSTLWQG